MGWAMLYLYILVSGSVSCVWSYSNLGFILVLSKPPHAMLVDNGQIAIHDLDSESSTPEILNDLLLDAAGGQAAATARRPASFMPRFRGVIDTQPVPIE